MASIDITSFSDLILRRKELTSNGGSLFQFNGLRAIEANQALASSRFNSSWRASTSGVIMFKPSQFHIYVFAASRSRAIRAMASAPKREKDPTKRVVITGMGLVSVFGNNVDIYYDKLLEGQSGITLIDKFDASTFSTHFAGQIRDFSSVGYIDGKNDRRLDDCWRYCLVAGKKALEDADLGPETLKIMDRSRIGVLVGSGIGGSTSLKNAVEALTRKGYKKISPFFIPYTISNMGSALLAIDTGLMGPNYSIATACATANYCIFSAANHIREGEADVMVAGGTDTGVTELAVGGFAACRALSRRNDEPHRASRPWDQSRDGFVLGEGSGVLIMESLEHATKRGANILAEYLGGAVTCDAHHMTDPRKDGLGVFSCITKCLEDSGISPEEVNYVNCHATSTPLGDLAEVNAMKMVFKDTSKIKMNGTKSMIGHSLGAAGGLEAIACIKAINTGWLHPTINQDVLLQGIPPNANIEDIERFLAGCEYDASSIRLFTRQSASGLTRMALVRCHSPTAAMSTMMTTNRGFCFNNQILVHVLQ